MCRSSRYKDPICVLSCDSSSPSLCPMHQTRKQWRKAECLKRRGGRGATSLVKGVCHLSRRAKRRLFCKWQLWMWRKRRGQLWRFRGKRCDLVVHCKHNISTACVGNGENLNVITSTAGSPVPQEASGAGEAAGWQNGLTLNGSSHIQTLDQNLSTETVDQTKPSGSMKLIGSSGELEQFQLNAPIGQDKRVGSTQLVSSDDFSLNLTRTIEEFLEGFYRKYGSFIPLHRSDVLKHLKRKFNLDFSDWTKLTISEVIRYQTRILERPAPCFRVVYKKHVLTLEDLLTLADQNWLNDQVMNMYGELIMESSNHKVHFLNSFFHRQLMTKGYEGVKRWTKQVDLFSKSLLLVPIHLEVHWCLVIADFALKKICLYDSQGHSLQKVARNILKYLMKEAKEKKQTAFEDGWAVSFDEEVPQQTNENDCGVFVLEFSQKDIPKIRKRIYKELCDRKLHEYN